MMTFLKRPIESIARKKRYWMTKQAHNTDNSTLKEREKLYVEVTDSYLSNQFDKEIFNQFFDVISFLFYFISSSLNQMGNLLV